MGQEEKTYFEVYDPLHSDVKYYDGTEKGRDRYYLASEVVYSSLNWWLEYIVISSKQKIYANEGEKVYGYSCFFRYTW